VDNNNAFEWIPTVLRRWRMIAIVTLAVMVAAVLASLFLVPRVYVAEVSLRTPNPTTTLSRLSEYMPVTLVSGLQSPSSTEEYIPIAQSYTLAERVIRRVKQQGFLQDEKVHEAAEKLRKLMSANLRRGVLYIRIRARGTARGFSLAPMDLDESGRAIGADVEARELAAALANAYAVELQNYLEQESLTTQKRTLEFIRNERKRARARLDEALKARQAFQEKHGTVALDRQTAALVDVMGQFERDEQAARAALADASASLKRARERQASIGKVEGLGLPATTDLLKRLYGERVEKQTELALKSQEMTSAHPEVQQLRAEIEQLDRRIEEEKARIRLAANKELDPDLVKLAVEEAGARARADSIRAAVAKLRARLQLVPGWARKLAELELDVQTKQAMYEVLTKEETRAEIEEHREGTWVQVLDAALPPTRPASPRLKLILALAFIVGLMFSVTWALAAESVASSGRLQLPAAEDDKDT